jgi:hypothetical protein
LTSDAQAAAHKFVWNGDLSPTAIVRESCTGGASLTGPQVAQSQDAEEQDPKIPLVDFAPGGKPPVRGTSPIGEEYAKDPIHIQAGQQLFQAFNCNCANRFMACPEAALGLV